MIKACLKAFILFWVLLSLNGCGSFIARHIAYERKDMSYTGIEYDLSLISDCFDECPNDHLLACVAVVPLSVIDLPLSLVSDTFYLPSDLMSYHKRIEADNAKKNEMSLK